MKMKWTDVEHRRFLLGLEIYGKGRWSKIAKKYVLTRNATQVASHAQKYFKRLEQQPNGKKRRRSIFDVPQRQTLIRPIPLYPAHPDWYLKILPPKKYCIK